MSDFWSVAVPNWIMAAGTFFTGITVLLGFRRHRRDMQQERAAAEQRDRDAARRVQASWAKTSDGTWGVLVTNQCQFPIDHLLVVATGNRHRFGAQIQRPQLEPGTHFFESNPNGGKYAWGLPQPVAEGACAPVSGKRHSIQSLEYVADGQGWRSMPSSDSRRLNDAERYNLERLSAR